MSSRLFRGAWPLLALFVFLPPREAPARQADADPSSWIGRRVLVRHGTVLLVDGKPVVDAGRGKNPDLVYKVKKADGDSLWIEAEGVRGKGWTTPDRLIPLERAVDFYTDRIRADPTSAANYNARGRARSIQKEYDKAVVDFDEAIRLDPRLALAYKNRGDARGDKDDNDGAVADYGEAIRLDPEYAAAYNNRAATWYAMGKYDEAVADYDATIRIDPDFVAAYSNRGGARIAMRDYDKAIADFDAAIRIDPEYAAAYNNRGVAWRNKEEYAKAAADFDAAIRLDPNYAVSYYNRGLARHMEGDRAKAAADYDAAIRLDPKYVDALGSRAWLWATDPDDKARDGKRAVETATKACESSAWKSPDALAILAAACAEAGDFEAAVKWQGRAAELLDGKDEAKRLEYRERLEQYQVGIPYREGLRIQVVKPPANAARPLPSETPPREARA